MCGRDSSGDVVASPEASHAPQASHATDAPRTAPWGVLDGDDVEAAAVSLLGCLLRRTVDGRVLVARIIETEAYDEKDPASHAFRGLTRRNRALFGPAGRAYVYVSYGIHRCLNITAGPDGFGAGALVRAVEPLEGLDVMESRRGRSGRDLTNGPGRLCQALDIGMDLYGHDLRLPPLELLPGALRPGERVLGTPRIGISRATDVPRRFVIDGNPWLSHASRDILKSARPVVPPAAGSVADAPAQGMSSRRRKRSTMTEIGIRRVYDPPQDSDGWRVLVDRLWPRGTSKAKARVDLWDRDVAPSKELRGWFGHIPERFPEFRERYVAELDANPAAASLLEDLRLRDRITLVFAAKDVKHNNAVVLRDWLLARLG